MTDEERREMIKTLVIPQIERFTAWLEQDDITPVRLSGGEADEVFTWPEIRQQWYRHMETFS
jgi:hypothetical protein